MSEETKRQWRPDRDCDENGDCGRTNAMRAQQAQEALGKPYFSGEGTQTDIQDLLSDLMHLCDRDDLDFEEALRMARDRYEEER